MSHFTVLVIGDIMAATVLPFSIGGYHMKESSAGRPPSPLRPWAYRSEWNDGDWVRYYIDRLHMTRTEVAIHMKVNERTIRRWCSQAKVPGAVMIALKSMVDGRIREANAN